MCKMCNKIFDHWFTVVILAVLIITLVSVGISIDNKVKPISHKIDNTLTLIEYQPENVIDYFFYITETGEGVYYMQYYLYHSKVIVNMDAIVYEMVMSQIDNGIEPSLPLVLYHLTKDNVIILDIMDEQDKEVFN